MVLEECDSCQAVCERERKWNGKSSTRWGAVCAREGERERRREGEREKERGRERRKGERE